jgi:RES domain-containing protein
LILWRAARRPYADLSGKGGLLHSGRWHSEGRLIVYTAEHPALALLEVRVNLDLPNELVPDDYLMQKIFAPDALQILESGLVNPKESGESRGIGDKWLSEGRSPLLKVPSAAAPESANFLINPLHADASKISIESAVPFAFDQRLFG